MEPKVPEVDLDLSNTGKLSSTIKGFLWNIRNWELKNIDSLIKKDRSASIKDISKYKEAQRLFPCPVILIDLQNANSALGFKLGQGEYSFETQPSNESVLQQLQGAGDTWHQMFDQHQSIVWIVVSKAEIINLRYDYSMLERAFEYCVFDEARMLQQIRDKALNDIGYHSIQLNRATGEPDIRIQATSRLVNNVHKALTSKDLVQDMMHYSKLSNLCPTSINDVMQRARLLYVHGYSEWEFLTMAVHYAVLSLEASLRLLYDTWLGPDQVEVEGKIDEGRASVCAKLKPSRDTILKWSNQHNVLNVKVKGWPLPRTKPNLTNHAVQIGALTQWERERIDYLMQLRDALSHPTDTFIQWINWSRNHISEICLLINLMWAKFLVGIPNDFSQTEQTKST
ncbi:hypothetical protein [Paenibacillus xylanexedens]|uniref:hypothetical protein n=1 Tax=Paenibacillus xylanexedens TaxID=528191 RepID=UPI0011A56853|nr:hypothetical protein [Paenibacillus xylanexedens]